MKLIALMAVLFFCVLGCKKNNEDALLKSNSNVACRYDRKVCTVNAEGKFTVKSEKDVCEDLEARSCVSQYQENLQSAQQNGFCRENGPATQEGTELWENFKPDIRGVCPGSERDELIKKVNTWQTSLNSSDVGACAFVKFSPFTVETCVDNFAEGECADQGRSKDNIPFPQVRGVYSSYQAQVLLFPNYSCKQVSELTSLDSLLNSNKNAATDPNEKFGACAYHDFSSNKVEKHPPYCQDNFSKTQCSKPPYVNNAGVEVSMMRGGGLKFHEGESCADLRAKCEENEKLWSCAAYCFASANNTEIKSYGNICEQFESSADSHCAALVRNEPKEIFQQWKNDCNGQIGVRTRLAE